MKNFAPVLIPTLNRYTHFKSCVESLAACTHANKTDLYIALDYPLHERHRAGYEKIKNYIPTIMGFKSIIVIERDNNYGAVDNFFKSLDEVFDKNDRLIFSEDDNLFSPDFLDFVNKGLEIYKDREDIFSINGYQYPVKLPKSYKNDIYLFKGFSAWGFGIWKDRWGKLSRDIDLLKTFLSEKEKESKQLNHSIIKGLTHIVETGYIAGDTLICYHQTVHNMYSVFPVISRVKNNGHDGSGIHGGNNKRTRNIYLNQSFSDGTLNICFPPDITPNQELLDSLSKHFNPSLFKKIINNPHLVIKRLKSTIYKK